VNNGLPVQFLREERPNGLVLGECECELGAGATLLSWREGQLLDGVLLVCCLTPAVTGRSEQREPRPVHCDVRLRHRPATYGSVW
jgi:hypothetical protein